MNVFSEDKKPNEVICMDIEEQFYRANDNMKEIRVLTKYAFLFCIVDRNPVFFDDACTSNWKPAY